MKRRYLIAIAIFLALALVHFKAKKFSHQSSLNECIAKLKQLEKESDSNPPYVMSPFQLFPVNAENNYRPTVFGYKVGFRSSTQRLKDFVGFHAWFYPTYQVSSYF
jgi:hypothetical protein